MLSLLLQGTIESCMYMYVCVCGSQKDVFTLTNTQIYSWICMCVCMYKAPVRPMPLTCEFFKRLHSRHTDLISNLLEDFKIIFTQRCSSFKYILVINRIFEN